VKGYEDNVVIACRWIDDLCSRGDLSVIEAIVAPDFVGHAPGGAVIRGWKGEKEMVGFYHEVVADPHWTVEDIIAAGDRVVVRTRGESTYAGGWHGIPASGVRGMSQRPVGASSAGPLGIVNRHVVTAPLRACAGGPDHSELANKLIAA
jgi:hypothetical protein